MYWKSGSGCGTVDSAVALDTRGPGLESSHRQHLLNVFTVCRKDKNKEKEALNGLFLKICVEKVFRVYDDDDEHQV